MHSPLHERLEYLVNYSSQLIFVSGDSIAQQQKNLEAFVFNQHDDTEIAYLTAAPDLELSDYRRQLCRQLLGQQVGSYVRPLNELLADLNSHQGPILITITQSENLPDTLLQELWDLVLQSRFAGNQQHLNVLLFGQSAWAENAKHWLPAKNSDTPLLISSQSVMAKQAGSELDQLIHQRRQAFEQHLIERQQAYPSASANRLKSPWLWASAVVVFLLCFSAMVVWQYGEHIEDLFAPIKAPPDDATVPAPGSAYPQLDSSAPSAPEDSGLSPAAADLSSPVASESDRPDTPLNNASLAISTGSGTGNEPEAPINTPANERVASWAAQVAAWDEVTPTEPTPTDTKDLQAIDNKKQASSQTAKTLTPPSGLSESAIANPADNAETESDAAPQLAPSG
ncbi:cell division protein DamX [Salinimonas marina]|uniref:Cell division protein DamX n=1 Tax=Salinimonas marina TaxID=2785918 RepID=A0A7S9DY43_9ALTE|nr:cell division protein DamX [Salinimonas marina]QPG05425.1 cell division protein DamX [Salinimonas marina]